MIDCRTFSILILAGTILTACASSKGDFDRLNTKEESMLVELKQPDSKQYNSAKVFISSVKKRTYNGTSGLLVTGQFSNGCSSLMDVSHQLKNQNSTISFTMEAWMPANAMCTQQLVPFSFLYADVSKEIIKTLESYEFDNEVHDIN